MEHLPRRAVTRWIGAAVLVLTPLDALAASGATDLATTFPAVLALLIFFVAYALVIVEEITGVRKSIPMLLGAGLIWALVAVAARQSRILAGNTVVEALKHNLLEYGELLLFLLAAMTYVNTLQERNVFAAMRSYLIARRVSLRAIFWITGAMAFLLSPFLDNLTTALVMGAVVLAMARGNRAFIVPACINIVVAANAGGAFSPFGDITTLMVWQKGIVSFQEFFALFLPALTNWLVPAACMSFAIPAGRPAAESAATRIKPWGRRIIALFAMTIALTVALYQFLQLPPFLGMMTGLGCLQLCGHFIRRGELSSAELASVALEVPPGMKAADKPFDVYVSMKRIEWDTLLFFYGVVLCVGGLGALGYLDLLSQASYASLGATSTNVLVGLASAVVDNIPIMFAVLSVGPDMSHGQWLLVTLTAGVGGSLLSIGSAAGVALMGQAHGVYTFFAHLKWAWAIALGYAASIWVHFAINGAHF